MAAARLHPRVHTWSWWRLVPQLLAGGAFLALRLHGISREALWVDEIISYPMDPGASLHEYIRWVLTENPPVTPLYFILQYYWCLLGFNSVLMLRLLPLFLEAAASTGAALMARRIHGPLAGWLTFGFCIVSSTHIYYALELRMYALVMLGTVAAMYAVWRYAAGGSSVWLGWALMGNAVVVWSHLLGGLCIIPQVLCLLWLRRAPFEPLAQWLLGVAALGIGCMAWYSQIDMANAEKLTQWVQAPTGARLFLALGWPYAYAEFLPWYLHPVIAGLALAAAGAALYRAHLRRAQEPEKAAAAWLLAGWLMIPPLALALLPLAGIQAFSPRYFLSSSYALFILLSCAVAGIGNRAARSIAVACLAAVLVLQGGFSMLQRPMRPDWAKAAAILHEQGLAGDTVITQNDGNRLPLRYYNTPYADNKTVVLSVEEARDAMLESCRTGRNIWVIEREAGEDSDWEKKLPREKAPYVCKEFTVPSRTGTLHLLRYSPSN